VKFYSYKNFICEILFVQKFYHWQLFIFYNRRVQPAARGPNAAHKTKYCGPQRSVNVKDIMIYSKLNLMNSFCCSSTLLLIKLYMTF